MSTKRKKIIKIEDGEKFLAIYQHKTWWVRPAFVDCIEMIPDKTQMLLVKNDVRYQVVLAVSTSTMRTDLYGTEKGIVATSVSSKDEETPIVIVKNGKDPYKLCYDATKEALELTNRNAMLRNHRIYPETFKYLGWCSWDAFYHDVSENGIIDKMQELSEKNLPIRWILIDDGWLDVDYEKKMLKSFNADRNKFPNGLISCVEKLKRDFSIDWVGVWHAIMGYWEGIKISSDIENRWKDYVYNLTEESVVVYPEEGKAFVFFDMWHNYLKNCCGIDFVKVDGQSSISNFYNNPEIKFKASSNIQKGLNASVAINFNNNVINCMGMAAEDVWNRPNSALSRSSDDFVPNTIGGFAEHALQNSYNSIWHGQFYWGDWDMFFSNHKENKLNSMLRAVSGGPVYISDKIGDTDINYIMPLIKKDGNIIRCENVGVPTMDCLFVNPIENEKILKIYNKYLDRIIVAVFHINDKKKKEDDRLSIEDIPELHDKEWIIYSWGEKKVGELTKEKQFEFELFQHDANIFTLIPKKNRVVIGNLEKYIGYGCVKNVWHEQTKIIVNLSEGGTLGIVCENNIEYIKCNGKKVNYKEEKMDEENIFVQINCLEFKKCECIVEVTFKE